MTVYAVTYDLNKTGQDYSGLINKLKTFKHFHYQKSCWLIKSDLEASEIFDELNTFIDSNDHLLVIEVKKHYKNRSKEKGKIKTLFE